MATGAPPAAAGYLVLQVAPRCGLFRSARAVRARYHCALDAATATLAARHTPRDPVVWRTSIAAAKLLFHDAELRIEVGDAGPGAGFVANRARAIGTDSLSSALSSTSLSGPGSITGSGDYVVSLVARERGDYFRWVSALQQCGSRGRALRAGGVVDSEFRMKYRLVSNAGVWRGGGGVGPVLAVCVDKKSGRQCVAAKVMAGRRPPAALNRVRRIDSGNADIAEVGVIVPVLDRFAGRGAAIEVTPRYELGTLGDWLKRPDFAAFSFAQVARLVRDIVAALETLHAEGLLHRTVGPHSVVLVDKDAELRKSWRKRSGACSHKSDTTSWNAPDGEDDVGEGDPRLLNCLLDRFDYACCKEEAAPERPGARTVPLLPSLAPEVMLSDEYGAPADMWAVGVLLYHLLTREEAFHARSELELIRAIETIDYAFTPDHRIAIPPAAIDLVQKLLVRAPDKRITATGARLHPFLADEVGATLPEFDRSVASSSISISAAVVTSPGDDTGDIDTLSFGNSDVDHIVLEEPRISTARAYARVQACNPGFRRSPYGSLGALQRQRPGVVPNDASGGSAVDFGSNADVDGKFKVAGSDRRDLELGSASAFGNNRSPTSNVVSAGTGVLLESRGAQEFYEAATLGDSTSCSELGDVHASERHIQEIEEPELGDVHRTEMSTCTVAPLLDAQSLAVEAGKGDWEAEPDCLLLENLGAEQVEDHHVEPPVLSLDFSEDGEVGAALLARLNDDDFDDYYAERDEGMEPFCTYAAQGSGGTSANFLGSWNYDAGYAFDSSPVSSHGPLKDIDRDCTKRVSSRPPCAKRLDVIRRAQSESAADQSLLLAARKSSCDSIGRGHLACGKLTTTLRAVSSETAAVGNVAASRYGKETVEPRGSLRPKRDDERRSQSLATLQSPTLTLL